MLRRYARIDDESNKKAAEIIKEKFERQAKLPKPSYISNDIAACAMKLFHQNYQWYKPIRSIGVRATDLDSEINPLQASIFENEEQREKLENLDKAVDSVRARFGHFCIQRASVLADKPLCGINPKGDHIIHMSLVRMR